MTFFVMLVSVGLNIVVFSEYDDAQECRKAVTEAVGWRTGDVNAICIDMKAGQIIAIAGRGKP